ncbi:hypothetical protein BSL78_10884 [Apostichopus japonicus]|uniref:DUF4470 domain-containing protein n=1 Tax=Stichopus japonicus TaxID=307972 RepID=A0A2G8KW73_STIJA|nr:hypothetical protein BSL78_10884 [Apostichopus japonicus]
MGDYPFYFSNSFANDLLNLQSNEMKGGQSVLKNVSILLPACGDLRHVMKTVESLPDDFNGSLKFVLNDIDPFSMARNVLLLFLITSCQAEEVSNVSTIWLSFQLPRKDYLLLQETLSKLIKMNSSHLKMKTGGMIDVNEQSYKAMREVWDEWRRYSCQIGTESGAKLYEERNAIFDSDPWVSVGLRGLLHDVPQQHASSVKKWFDDGVILPDAHAENTVTHYNPTFTGRGWGDKHAEAKGKGKLPKLSDVSNRRGLLMRDFRKGGESCCPFNQRVAVRTVNMLKGDVRTLEWHRAPKE